MLDLGLRRTWPVSHILSVCLGGVENIDPHTSTKFLVCSEWPNLLFPFHLFSITHRELMWDSWWGWLLPPSEGRRELVFEWSRPTFSLPLDSSQTSQDSGAGQGGVQSRRIQRRMLLFVFVFSVLPVYCYQPISLHPNACMLSHGTPWTAAHQAPLSMNFSRQEYWSGLPFPSPCFFFFFKLVLSW